MKTSIIKIFYLFAAPLFAFPALSQTTDATREVVPGPQYKKGKGYQLLWGRHYRKEWTTPAKFPLLYLDTAAGGLRPYEAGGGNQSKNLKLRNAQGKEYVLRSIDKRFGQALPEIFQHTFVERLINDQVSIAHPYAALTVPQMADAAGVYHTIPSIVYVPQQPALDTFNERYGNALYLFEQRPDENWEDAANFGYSKKIIGTDDLLPLLQKNPNNRVDQQVYLRARLFDMLIGDWGRHEDQWRWASFKENGGTVYRPIPRDRDQTYTRFDGLLLNTLLSAGGLSHLETFDNRVDDITSYNFPARHLDRRMTNELTLDQWIATAQALQQSVTDDVITTAVHNLPQEVYALSGDGIIAAIRQRRKDLVTYATTYYRFLAEEVEVPGTREDERFEINNSPEGTEIKVYTLKNGLPVPQPWYHRKFEKGTTSEIRLFGIGGQDQFVASGVSNNIIVRIIGGTGHDSVAVAERNRNLVYYDDHNNAVPKGIRLKLSEDTSIHNYQYNWFHYDSKGLGPEVFYNYEDKLYVGLGYKWKNHKWRREPFAHEHRVSARYSVIQNAMSFTYSGTVNQFIGEWSLDLLAQYDAIRWTNYFGSGNETVEATTNRDYYRMRSHEGLARVLLGRQLGKGGWLQAGPFFRHMKIVEDKERFLAGTLQDGMLYKSRQYAGGLLRTGFSFVDDAVLPKKGVEALASVSYTANTKETDKTVEQYAAGLGIYLPVTKRWVVALRGGAATVSGKPDFFQLTSIGGSNSLRGYRRDRFWGKSSFYNSNELQYHFRFRSFLFNGNAALFGLYDLGRVWQPGEISQTLHTAYGGGITLAPFNKIAVSLSYAVSKENGVFHIRLGRSL